MILINLAEVMVGRSVLVFGGKGYLKSVMMLSHLFFQIIFFMFSKLGKASWEKKKED